MTITEFLLARIAEDEARARSYGATVAVGEHADWCRTPELVDGRCFYCGAPSRPASPSERVLAECEAKRRIVEAHAGWHVCPNLDAKGYTDYDDGSDGDEWGMTACPTVRLMALAYADHLDYLPEWKP